MKRVAIIGSESFLAQNLIAYFEMKKDCPKLYLYDHKESAMVKQTHEYSCIDFNSVDSLRRIDFDVDAVYIFIGKTGNVNGFDEYRDFIDVNEKFFLGILNTYVEQNSHARIIYPGSRLVFRSSDDKINEDSIKDPKSIYSVTKLACEYYLKIYKECFGIEYVVLRICTPFDSIVGHEGNYGTFKIFSEQAKESGVIKVFGKGDQTKTYTHMRDICLAFEKLLMADHVKYAEYNLGGCALSINEIADVIANKYNARIKHVNWEGLYESVDGGTVVFDSSRFDSEFDMKYLDIL